MKTWTLVWFLVFPPNDSGEIAWEQHQQADLTSRQCFEQLAEKDTEYRELQVDGKIVGYEIYCKEN